MNFLLELWAVIVSSIISFFTSVENEVLAKISNLLTILVIIIGLIDWLVRKHRNRANLKRQKTLEIIEGTQKPFKAVNMLNNPMRTSEKIGTLIEDTTKMLGGKKMKKFIKWIWYNKEQLLSIVYNVAIIVIANFLMWTDLLSGFFANFGNVKIVLAIKLIAFGLSLVFAALTVRNVCVKYGLSSLETIDNVLKQKAEAAENKLTPEQKKSYKNNISILQDALEKANTEMKNAETELERMTALYNADSSFVADYVVKRAAYEKKITASKAVVTNIEGKIAVYKAYLKSGTNTENK